MPSIMNQSDDDVNANIDGSLRSEGDESFLDLNCRRVSSNFSTCSSITHDFHGSFSSINASPAEKRKRLENMSLQWTQQCLVELQQQDQMMSPPTKTPRKSLQKKLLQPLPPLPDDADDEFTFKTVSTDDDFTYKTVSTDGDDSIEEDEVTSNPTSIRILEKPEASGSSHETQNKQSNHTSDVGAEKQSSRQYKENKSNDKLKKDSSQSKKNCAANKETDGSQFKKEKRRSSSSNLKKESSDISRKLKKDSSSRSRVLLESQLNESTRTVKKSNSSSHETKNKQSNRASDVGIEKQNRQYKENKSNDKLKKDSSRSKKLRADNKETDSSQSKKEKRPSSSSKLKKESSDIHRKLKKDSISRSRVLLESQLNESTRTVKKSNRSKKLQKSSSSRMDESRDNVNSRREQLSGSRRVSFSSECKWAYLLDKSRDNANRREQLSGSRRVSFSSKYKLAYFEQRTQAEKNASFYSQEEYKRIYNENINIIQKMESNKTKLSASETKHFRGLLDLQAMNEREQRIKFTVSQVLREQEKRKTLGEDWVKDFSNKFSKQTAIAALNVARMDAKAARKAARSLTRRASAPPVWQHKACTTRRKSQ